MSVVTPSPTCQTAGGQSSQTAGLPCPALPCACPALTSHPPSPLPLSMPAGSLAHAPISPFPLLTQASKTCLMTTLRLVCSGSVGLGHVRYPTAGTSSVQEAQPFFVNSPLGMYLIHNGNITNTDELKVLLNSKSSFFNRYLRTDSDSEVTTAP